MGERVKIGARILLVICLVVAAHVAFAQSVFIHQPSNNISTDAYWYIDSTNTLSFQEIEANQKFQSSNNTVLNINAGNITVWLRYILQPTIESSNWYIYIESVEHDSLWFYSKQNGVWQEQINGLHYKPQQTAKPHRNFYFSLNLEHYKADTIYIKAKNTVSFQFPVHLFSNSGFYEFNYKIEQYYGVYFGFMICMFLYNLILSIRTRNKLYTFYAFTVLSTILLFSSISGHLYYWFFSEFPVFRSYLLISFAGLLVVAVSVFMIQVLELKRFAPVSYRLFLFFIAIGAYLVVFNFILGRRAHIELANSLVGVVALSIVISASVVYVKGNKYAIYIAVGWLAYALGGITFILKNLGYLPINNFTMHAPEIGSAIEVVLVAVSLGKRINDLQKEREDVTLSLLEIKEQQNVELEKLVVERTKEIAELAQNLSVKNEKIEKQFQKLNDGLELSASIQVAMHPSIELVKTIFSEAFVVQQPKDYVGGDFYWVHTKGNKTVLVVADCSGDGIVGALMSNLTYGLLNKIIIEQGELQPSRILEVLDDEFIALAKVNSSVINQLAISVVQIDKNKNQLTFCAAQQKLMVVQEDLKTSIYNGTRKPLGVNYSTPIVFRDQIIHASGNNTYFLFTNGYKDQYINEQQKKFGIGAFTGLLKLISQFPVEKQEEMLVDKFNEFLLQHEQVDDMLVIGFKI